MKKKYILISLLLIFLLITILVITNNTILFDNSIYKFLFSLRNNTLDSIMKNITKFGNTTFIIMTLIILIIILKKDDGYLLLINVISTIGMNQLLKYIIRRPRPDHLRLIVEKGFSYPSGHSMISIGLYGFIIYIINKKIKDKYLKIPLIIIFSLLIIGIGLSRIYLGVHYPSDVLGGYILSFIIMILVINYYNNHFRGNKNDKNDS